MADHADIDHTGITGAGLGSGTSFPGTPSTDDLFHRTDRDLIYFYDGTRWLCICPHTLPITQRAAASTHTATTSMGAAPTNGASGDIYVEKFRCTAFMVSTAADGTNFWTATLDKRDSANTQTIISTLTMNSQTANTWKEWVNSVNAVVVGSASIAFQVILTKAASAPAIIPAFEVTYRHVG